MLKLGISRRKKGKRWKPQVKLKSLIASSVLPLGVPTEFMLREDLQANPVTGLRSGRASSKIL